MCDVDCVLGGKTIRKEIGLEESRLQDDQMGKGREKGRHPKGIAWMKFREGWIGICRESQENLLFRRRVILNREEGSWVKVSRSCGEVGCVNTVSRIREKRNTPHFLFPKSCRSAFVVRTQCCNSRCAKALECPLRLSAFVPSLDFAAWICPHLTLDTVLSSVFGIGAPDSQPLPNCYCFWHDKSQAGSSTRSSSVKQLVPKL